MCLLALAVDVVPGHPLVVLANRDEWLARPTARLHTWPQGIVAGRDLEGGGTWLGVAPSGRFAALTNVRDARDMRPKAPGEPSRGALVTSFLLGAESAERFVTAAAANVEMRGFNLVAGTIAGALWWSSNRGGTPARLAVGVHGLSNALLDTPWPKVERAKAALTAARDLDPERLFSILADRTQPPDEALPETGVGLVLERALAPIQVSMPGYGTRSSTLVLGQGRAVTVIERAIAPEPADDVCIEVGLRDG